VLRESADMCICVFSCCCVFCSSPPLQSCTSVQVRKYSGGFQGREKAAENRAIQEHERELLEKLKNKLRAERSPDSEKHAAVIEKLQNAIHDIKLPESAVQEAKEQLTAEDFMELRSELLTKVRALEDQLAHLKVSSKSKKD
jgi:hypothetical protein